MKRLLLTSAAGSIGGIFEESLDKRTELPKFDAPDAVYQGNYFTVELIYTSENY